MREMMNVIGKKLPCKDCTDREVGCHSKCNQYIEWKKHEDLLKAERREVGRAISDIIDYKRRVVVKHKKKRGEYNK